MLKLRLLINGRQDCFQVEVVRISSSHDEIPYEFSISAPLHLQGLVPAAEQQLAIDPPYMNFADKLFSKYKNYYQAAQTDQGREDNCQRGHCRQKAIWAEMDLFASPLNQKALISSQC